MGVSIPDVLQSTASSSFSFSVIQFGTLSCFGSVEEHYFNRFVLNMVKGHHLQLRSHPPLLGNFKVFSVKAAAAQHPIIQKEVYELLAKGAIEPLPGGVGF